jgi:hypothetical protein
VQLKGADKEGSTGVDDSAADCDDSKRLRLNVHPVRDVLGRLDLSERLEANVRSNPTELIRKAEQGDSAAASAVFQVLASCYPLATPYEKIAKLKPSPGCPPVGRDVLEHRFNLLEPFALKGDPRIQTLYALNAAMVAQLWSRSSIETELIEATRLRQNAEKFARSAAGNGAREAFYFLVGAYMSGTFGPPDLELAYTYLLPLERVDPSPEMQAQLNSLSKRLSSSERLAAERRAFGCKRSEAPASVANPFN